MKYIRVAWNHAPDDRDDSPVLIYSELDSERNEIRKIHVFSDGRVEYASAEGGTSNTDLSETAIPELEEIASDPVFSPSEITREEFEALWAKRG